MNLIFLRHGLSKWNLENKFTGWIDVSLARQGIVEANQAKNILEESNFNPDVVFTSFLKRAQQTAQIVTDVQFIKDWRLNERHYGALQGLDKKETVKKYGEDQVFLWRRSYLTKPPILPEDSPDNPNNLEMYEDIKTKLPLCESLEDVVIRIKPVLKKILNNSVDMNVLVVAHGNSIRAILKIIENIENKEISDINIPTGIPLAFNVEEVSNKKSIQRIGYLGNPKDVFKATKEVEQQSQIKEK